MPELPEVETLRRELSKTIKGKTIKSAEGDWPKMVKPLSIPEFQKKIKNKKIIGVKRRSKVLILDLACSPKSEGCRRAGPLSLLIHLKLTGQLIYEAKSYKLTAKSLNYTHLILSFTDGSKLYFNDLRKFGWARLADDEGVNEVIEAHGPEPLAKEFTPAYLSLILKKYPNRKIKQILLDQKLIGGIGNIYCDEACFCARVLPMRLAKKFKPQEIKKLFACINQVIKFAVAKKGTSADTYVRLNGQTGGMEPYLKIYGRKGEKCKRCGGVVQRTKLNGRGTHFCSACQRA